MEARGENCQIRDGLSFLSETASRFVSGWHTRLYRYLPGLNQSSYQFWEKHPAMFEEKSVIYRLLADGSERLGRYIRQEGYEAVICTHVFPAVMVTDMLRRYPALLATGFVATDYTCSPMTKDSRMDRYFIPDASLTAEFVCETIPEDRIVSCGIPVREEFYRQEEKRKAREAFGIRQDSRHLLMMCGSMGCGPMMEMAKLLAKQMSPGQELSIVCGSNRSLQKKLLHRFEGWQQIHVWGFVDNMSLLMDSADLYLTKPGGISTSEAAVKQLPMVLIDAVAGCEAYNLRFFTGLGGAQAASNPKQTAKMCCMLLQQEEQLQGMRRKLMEISRQRAAVQIGSSMEEVWKEKEVQNREN